MGGPCCGLSVHVEHRGVVHPQDLCIPEWVGISCSLTSLDQDERVGAGVDGVLLSANIVRGVVNVEGLDREVAICVTVSFLFVRADSRLTTLCANSPCGMGT